MNLYKWIYAFFQEFLRIMQPLLLGGLIRYFDADTKVTKTDAYLYALGMTLSAAFMSISHHTYFYQTQKLGMDARVACSSLIYKKVNGKQC